MRSVFKTVGPHEVHVTEWGKPTNPPLVMWHGLARTGRDFDELGLALSDEWFVICPDTIGRGLSSWANDPATEYRLPAYADLAVGLLDAYGFDRVAWLGTSMGGLIGMKVAAGAYAARLRCLIINDIGPEIPQPAIDRILTYAADLPYFGTISGAETWLRTVYAPFGPADDRFWARMAETSVRRCGDGRLTLHYDPRIVEMLTGDPETLKLWDAFARINIPTHVVQGASSDILPDDIASRMHRTGPCPQVSVFDDCGHAPSLSRTDDIALMRDVLKRLLSN